MIFPTPNLLMSNPKIEINVTGGKNPLPTTNLTTQSYRNLLPRTSNLRHRGTHTIFLQSVTSSHCYSSSLFTFLILCIYYQYFHLLASAIKFSTSGPQGYPFPRKQRPESTKTSAKSESLYFLLFYISLFLISLKRYNSRFNRHNSNNLILNNPILK